MSQDTLPPPSELGMPLLGRRLAAVTWFNERVYSGEYAIVPVTTCFCGAAQFERLSRFDRYGLPFGTQICIKCGLISQTRHLAGEAMESFYNDIYWDLIAGDHQSTFKTPMASFEPFLAMMAPLLGGTINTIAEVGCGSGDRLVALAERITPRPKLIGCDYSLTALERARARGIETRVGSFDALKGREKADVLILSHIVEHLVDLKSALADIREVTHENSVIYVEVPGVIDLPNKREYGYDYQDYCVIAHIHNFCLSSLARVFDSGGFGLVTGDEFARAVFRRNHTTARPVAASCYEETRAALRTAEGKSVVHKARILPKIKARLQAAVPELIK